MSHENQQAKRGWFGRIWHNVMFRLLPALLLLGIIWSALIVGQALLDNLSANQTLAERQDAYAATATALAPDDSASANNLMRHVQFATNTPEAQPTQASNSSGDSSAFPTNTPAVTATPIPSSTPLPATTVASPAQSGNTTPVALPTFSGVVDASIVEASGTAVPQRAGVVPRDYELVNIVLLGSDGEITNDNTIRTDTMIIVSVNTETGSVSMLSLPRDLFVYTPTPTMTRLNTVYGIGEAFGWTGGGFGLLRETIFYNFGIQVHYHARIDLSGMAELIDTIGGVELAVDCTYQDFALIGAEVPEAAVVIDEEALLYELPVGYYQMSGSEALWFARTRSQGNADDFDRGRRQQQLLRAMFRAALDSDLLPQVPTLWDEVTQIVETDLPVSVVAGLLPIGLNLDTGNIETFNWIKGYHSRPWQPPIGSFAGQSVHLLNTDAVSQLLVDFYTPPTESQLEIAGPSIAVYNGTPNENWDLVVSERLRGVGLNAYAAGPASQRDYPSTVLADYRAQDKGSPVRVLLEELDLNLSDIDLSPDPNRTVDYEVIVGANYDSCAGSVLQ